MKKIIPTTRRPDITFHVSGKIFITSRVARILNLDKDSCINIAIDRGEFLLFAERYHNGMIGNHAGRCYPVNAGSRYLRANSVTLCRAILDACGATRRAPLMCGEAILINGKPHLPIITKITL